MDFDNAHIGFLWTFISTIWTLQKKHHCEHQELDMFNVFQHMGIYWWNLNCISIIQICPLVSTSCLSFDFTECSANIRHNDTPNDVTGVASLPRHTQCHTSLVWSDPGKMRGTLQQELLRWSSTINGRQLKKPHPNPSAKPAAYCILNLGIVYLSGNVETETDIVLEAETLSSCSLRELSLKSWKHRKSPHRSTFWLQNISSPTAQLHTIAPFP